MAKKTTRGPDLGTLPIKRVAFKRIKAATYNPRVALKPGDPEYEKLARSIDEFGLVEPLIWNKQTGNLVGGHQRMAILKDRGVTSADVVVVDLDLPREKTLNLALNKIAGRWDTEKLAGVLDELAADDSIDELFSGFDENEIADLLAQMDDEDDGPTGEPGADPTDADDRHTRIDHSFKVVATCKNQRQQKKAYDLLMKQGIACHMLTRK